MFGGTETVALAFEWVLTELLRSPENMKRVQDELATVVGLERWSVEDTHLEKLTFLKCVYSRRLSGSTRRSLSSSTRRSRTPRSPVTPFPRDHV